MCDSPATEIANSDALVISFHAQPTRYADTLYQCGEDRRVLKRFGTKLLEEHDFSIEMCSIHNKFFNEMQKHFGKFKWDRRFSGDFFSLSQEIDNYKILTVVSAGQINEGNKAPKNLILLEGIIPTVRLIVNPVCKTFEKFLMTKKEFETNLSKYVCTYGLYKEDTEHPTFKRDEECYYLIVKTLIDKLIEGGVVSR